MRTSITCLAILILAASANAAVTSVTIHGATSTSLNDQIIVGDILSGMIPTVLPVDTGWHPANTDPLDQLPAFTDDGGIRGTGLTGLLNDFPGAGIPAKRVQYDLNAPTDISQIQILSGNNGKDGRIFSTTVISLSTDGGSNFSQLGYFQSDPSGTINTGPDAFGATLVKITDDGGGLLASGVTNLIFEFFAVDNTGGQMRDPFDGVNPYTGIDDTLSAAFVSPLILEIDAIPEPSSILLILGGLVGLLVLRR
ncbi:MAG: PEP-CTERM sorting domain-containing protein [Pirellulales bacterium]|nr:PEP-CTERM sorting domain-containing protein [Pirellulales bacterium]